MCVPVILGSDKMTVSVATGQNDYYLLYGLIGNIHNNVCHAHQSALDLIGFLSIPKSKCASPLLDIKCSWIKRQTENLMMILNSANSAANFSIHHYKHFSNPYDLE